MTIFTWIVFGLIVGIVANVIDPKKDEGGLLGAGILGVLGAVLGGLLANLLFGIGINGFNLTSLAIAVLGSLFLLFVGRMVKT